MNGNFPGPPINVTTNYNVAVNVWNDLDENLLMTWFVYLKTNSQCFLCSFSLSCCKQRVGV